jgi:hypothetical protein
MSDTPTPSAAGTGAIYGHSAEGVKAAEEDVKIPGGSQDDEAAAEDDDPEVKHETGLA